MRAVPRIAVTAALSFVLAAAAYASDLRLDAAGGSLFVTDLDPARPADYVGTGDGKWVRREIVRQAASVAPIIGVSHSSSGLGVHFGAGGSAPLTTALFRNGGGSVGNAPYRLLDPRTGVSWAPAAVRTIVLDPSEPAGSTVLQDAGHVVLPRGAQYRGLALMTRAGGEVVVADFDFAGGPVRRTPLGFTPPIGSNKGSFTVSPAGSVWAAITSPDGVRLFDLGDLSATGALQPVQLAMIGVETGWEGTSARMGIIAILIGLVAEPAPAVSFQTGNELVTLVLDGTRFREVRRQALPAGAQGLIEEEGIFYYLLPFIEQENLYKSAGWTADSELVLEIER
jgi:hypothetical protein